MALSGSKKLTRHFAFSGKFGLVPRGRKTISIATELELNASPVNCLATDQRSCGEEFHFVRPKVMLRKTVEKANKTHSDVAGCPTLYSDLNSPCFADRMNHSSILLDELTAFAEKHRIIEITSGSGVRVLSASACDQPKVFHVFTISALGPEHFRFYRRPPGRPQQVARFGLPRGSLPWKRNSARIDSCGFVNYPERHLRLASLRMQPDPGAMTPA